MRQIFCKFEGGGNCIEVYPRGRDLNDYSPVVLIEDENIVNFKLQNFTLIVFQ